MREPLTVFFLSFVLSFLAFAQNQGASQPASPRGQAQFEFSDGKKIGVDYGRPYMRGRKIMGGLLPYGKVWRTGANAATGFITEVDLDLAGARVPAGKYTLYTIPGEQSWTVIINRQTGQWGLTYNQPQDLVRVQVKPTALPQPVDQFTISFEPRGAKAGVMKLEWENTSVPVEFRRRD
jgi:hypothetical protein